MVCKKLHGWNSRGAIFILALPLFAVLLTFLFGILALGREFQGEIAHRYRLQVCALDAAILRRNFYHRLAAIHQAMIPLQNTVYVSRGIRWIPGVQLGTQITESAALAALRSLASARNLLVQGQSLREIAKKRCAENPFDQAKAWCSFPVFNASQLKPRPTLFPDVPPTLMLGEGSRRYRFACRGIRHKKFREEAVGISGNANLLAHSFNYEFK